MVMSFDARRKALTRAKEQADKAAKAAAAAEAKRKKLAAQEKAMRDALIVDAVRELFPGIDDADDPAAFIRGVMEGGTPDVDSANGATSADDASAFDDDSDEGASGAISVDALL